MAIFANAIPLGLSHGVNFRMVDNAKSLPKEYHTVYFTKFNHAVEAFKRLHEMYGRNGHAVSLSIQFRNTLKRKTERWVQWIEVYKNEGLGGLVFVREDIMFGSMVSVDELRENAEYQQERRIKRIPDRYMGLAATKVIYHEKTPNNPNETVFEPYDPSDFFKSEENTLLDDSEA